MGNFSFIHNSMGHTKANVFFLWAGAVGFTGAVLLLGFRLYVVHRTVKALWEHNRKKYLKRLLVGMFTAGVSDGNEAGQVSLEEDLTGFGLDPFVLENLPTFTAGRGSEWLESKEKGDCPVCLLAFRDGQKGRFLPQCNHYFHAECIDMWFFSHSTCPLCRSEVGPPRETLLDEPAECLSPGSGFQLITLPSLCFSDDMAASSEEPLTSGKTTLPQHHVDVEPGETSDDIYGERVRLEVGENVYQGSRGTDVVIELGETVDLGVGHELNLDPRQIGSDSQTKEPTAGMANDH